MAFEQDVFISYTPIDNRPAHDGETGWVTGFHRILERRLARLLGREPRIWRDDKQQGNDVVADDTAERFKDVALLVAVLSPDYLKSEACLRELQHFCQAAISLGGLRAAGTRPRIFTAIKAPIPIENRPKQLQVVRGYEFFEFESDRLLLYSPELDRRGNLQFVQAIDDLACEMAKLLQQLTAESESQQPLTALHKPMVYLAETSRELTAARAQVRQELELSGYGVLPDCPLPYTGEFSKAIQSTMTKCDLSVHLLVDGDAPAGRQDSLATQLPQLEVARIGEQLMLAAACAREKSEFVQILWLPSDRGRDFWAGKVAELPGKPDVLQTGIEELKRVILTRIERRVKGESKQTSGGQPLQVYLDFAPQDAEEPELKRIYELLSQQFEILMPDYKAGEGMKSSEEKLCRADGGLIYYGKGSEVWFERRWKAMQKRFTGERSQLPQAIFIASPIVPTKLEQVVPGVMVVCETVPFLPKLPSFAAKMNQIQGG